MTRSRFYMMAVLLAATVLGGCSSKPPVMPNNDGKCIGMADDLKTLKPGDELPRVVQVLGWPTKSYRTFGFFGHAFDVLVYDMGPGPCVKALLHSEQNLLVVFDNKGRYVGSGGIEYMKTLKRTTWREEPLVLDRSILKP